MKSCLQTKHTLQQQAIQVAIDNIIAIIVYQLDTMAYQVQQNSSQVYKALFNWNSKSPN